MSSVGGHKYDASSIKVLEGLEAVRKRPAMYIGDTALAGLHHLVNEVVDNAIDEAMVGFCDEITVHVHADGSITVRDNGRGIPIDIHETEGKPAIEVVMTTLHAGGKFDKSAYKVSGGLHGVGVSVVNALSEWLQVEVYRDGKIYSMRFERGKKVTELEEVGTTKRTGTRVTFKPDPEIFPDTNFRYETLAARLRELAYLNEGVKIILRDDRVNKEEVFHYTEGIKAFVEHLNEGKNALHPVIRFQGEDSEYKLICDVAMQYTDSYTENILAFANNIHNIDGGTHLSGFKSALTRTMNRYAKGVGLIKDKFALTGDDLREGLAAVISVKVPEPQFEAQTKVKLTNPEVGSFVEQTVNERLGFWLEEHPTEAKRIITKAIQAAQAREAAKKARELARKSVMDSTALPGKLWDCSSKDVDSTEIFLVEGDSAGGNAKQGRDARYQAVLPLRGKILNVEKARINKVLDHNEIKTIISAIGTGIGEEEFDIKKRRYGKVIIMTDADVDGSHIRTLLLTFLFRHMRPLIENGCVYVAQPPLFQLSRRSKVEYVLDERQLNDRLTEMGLEGTSLHIRKLDSEGNIIDEVEKEVAGKSLRKLIDLVDEFESYLNILRRRAIDVYEYLVKWFDEQEGLPKIRAVLDGEQYFFYSEKQFTEFCKRAREKFGQIEIDDSSHPRQDSESGVVIGRMDLGEARSVEKIIHQLRAEWNITVEDYFRRPEEDITGRLLPTRFVLKLPDGKTRSIPSFSEIPKAVRDYGATGIEVKRFKGLGEMNPEELWSTTMDPERRTLRKVTISEEPDDPVQYQIDLREADRIFSILMGDDVEQRRRFIETHATEVKNLDV